jgi:hypothetical protein
MYYRLIELNILLRYITVYNKFVVTNVPQNGACPLLINRKFNSYSNYAIGLNTKMLIKNNTFKRTRFVWTNV